MMKLRMKSRETFPAPRRAAQVFADIKVVHLRRQKTRGQISIETLHPITTTNHRSALTSKSATKNPIIRWGAWEYELLGLPLGACSGSILQLENHFWPGPNNPMKCKILRTRSA